MLILRFPALTAMKHMVQVLAQCSDPTQTPGLVLLTGVPCATTVIIITATGMPVWAAQRQVVMRMPPSIV
ncbi:MAG: hypothetical protein AB1480_14090 [Nitrospirota bacterium]